MLKFEDNNGNETVAMSNQERNPLSTLSYYFGSPQELELPNTTPHKGPYNKATDVMQHNNRQEVCYNEVEYFKH